MNATVIVKKGKSIWHIPCVLKSCPKGCDKDKVVNKVEDRIITLLDEKYYKT